MTLTVPSTGTEITEVNFAAIGEPVTTYVVKSEPDDVTFEIVESGVAVLTPTYYANSKEQTIIFRFTAVNTPLSEGSCWVQSSKRLEYLHKERWVTMTRVR